MEMLGTAILIKPDKLPERTDSGVLIIPKSSKEMLTDWGTVEKVGPECGEIKLGMRVIFPRKQASVIVIDDRDFYIIHERHIKYYE
jgi:co-chaperonin GroES (HSP10)